MKIRLSQEADAAYLKEWYSEPETLQWFPMINEREIDDSIRFWKFYIPQKSTFTAEIDGEPVGIAYLNIHSCEKLRHQCLLTIVVAKGHRGKGIGTELLAHLKRQAKDVFGIEVLHLEVYEGNPAIRLYRRNGFTEYGTHPHYLKEFDAYLTKILMQQELA